MIRVMLLIVALMSVAVLPGCGVKGNPVPPPASP